MTRRTSRAAQYNVDPVPVAREALRRGAIEPRGAHYGFGRRKFNRATVNQLVETGEARRLEDGRVVARAAFPTVMSSEICPRCRMRYLPLSGGCICEAP